MSEDQYYDAQMEKQEIEGARYDEFEKGYVATNLKDEGELLNVFGNCLDDLVKIFLANPNNIFTEQVKSQLEADALEAYNFQYK